MSRRTARSLSGFRRGEDVDKGVCGQAPFTTGLFGFLALEASHVFFWNA